MIVKTEAVVLQARRYRESSRIITLFTRDYGRMSVVARGVMQPRSRLGSVLQPLSHISAVVYRKDGRDLQNLSTAECIGRSDGITATLERMSAAMAVVEIVNAAVHDEDRNDELFDALVATLAELNRPDADASAMQIWFHLRLAAVLGYAVNLETCGVCGEQFDALRDPVPFNLSVAAPLCSEHQVSLPYRPLRRESFDTLRALLASDATEAGRVAISDVAGTELVDMLTSYIRYHVDGLRKLKVGAVSAKVLDVVRT